MVLENNGQLIFFTMDKCSIYRALRVPHIRKHKPFISEAFNLRFFDLLSFRRYPNRVLLSTALNVKTPLFPKGKYLSLTIQYLRRLLVEMNPLSSLLHHRLTGRSMLPFSSLLGIILIWVNR